jgi:uncharacterized membrane protein
MAAMFTKTDIENYFIAEKQESLLFLIMGIIGVVLAIVFFFFLKTSFYKCAAIPLLLLGLLMGTAGYIVYKRSDGDRIRNVYDYDMNPSQLKNIEQPRMKTVMKNFVIYRYTEILFVLAGIFLFVYFKDNPERVFWKGFGFTLAILALLALSADYFAEKRGKVYSKGIESFVTKL